MPFSSAVQIGAIMGALARQGLAHGWIAGTRVTKAPLRENVGDYEEGAAESAGYYAATENIAAAPDYPASLLSLITVHCNG